MSTATFLTAPIYDHIADELADKGYIILPEIVPAQLTEQLYQHVTTLPAGQFKQAGIGRNKDLQVNQQIRNDKTLWLSTEHECSQAYLAAMDKLRQQLNRRLFLGLSDYEAHFAHYSAGNYYQRHIDAFKGLSNRVVTTVFYLNPDWQQHNGGELIIYQPDSENIIQRVLPKFGTMVIFLSEQFPHEVLPAKQDRYSIAGWFRVDT